MERKVIRIDWNANGVSKMTDEEIIEHNRRHDKGEKRFTNATSERKDELMNFQHFPDKQQKIDQDQEQDQRREAA